MMRTITVALILLLVLSAAPLAQGGEVLVLYPDAPPPYRLAFEQIIKGLEQTARQPVQTLSLASDYDVSTVERWIDEHARSGATLVLLGQRALDAYARLSTKVPAFVGAVSRLDGKTDLPGVSMTIATPVVLDTVRRLLPATRTVIVFYNARLSAWNPSDTRTPAVRDLDIRPVAVANAEAAVKEITQIIETVNPNTTALWLTEGTISLNTELILPFVLEESWKRRIPVFSDTPSYVKRGLLFALYPDYYGMGVELGSRLPPTAANPPRGITLTRAARFAINTRTAQHLGISLRSDLIEKADAVFPTP